MNKTISIVIPNYNGAQILQENLPIILEYAKKYNAKITIVDDASTDDSIKIISEKFPEVTLIKKPKNDGFSSSVNLGVRSVDTELVCLLNSDIIPSQDFLDPLIPYFDDPEVAAVGMMDLSDDKDFHGRGKFIIHNGLIAHQKLVTLNSQSKDNTLDLESGLTGWVSCGSGLFSKKIWDELGGLDELLNPFYFEDVDYGYRAWKSGSKMYFEKKSIVEHVHKKGAIKTHYDQNRIKTISFTNQCIVSLKNLTDLNLVITLLLILPTFMIRPWLPLWYRDGIYNFLKKAPQILEKRNQNKKLFKYTDSQVLLMVKN